jgi:hypothetical protein
MSASAARTTMASTLTKRAVEKHVNSIFLKLGLTQTMDVSRRVKAALIHLAEADMASRSSSAM